MWASLWAGAVEWAAARTTTFWIAAALCLFMFLSGGCCVVVCNHLRPHWIVKTTAE